MTTRRVPVPQSLPGGLTLDQLHALYGRLDILRDDLSGLFEDGYLPSLRAALNVELARIYGAMLGRDTTACQPGRHRPDCGWARIDIGEDYRPAYASPLPQAELDDAEAEDEWGGVKDDYASPVYVDGERITPSEAELAELDGLRVDALEHEQAAVYEEIAEAEERAAWGDR